MCLAIDHCDYGVIIFCVAVEDVFNGIILYPWVTERAIVDGSVSRRVGGVASVISLRLTDNRSTRDSRAGLCVIIRSCLNKVRDHVLV